LDAPRSAGRPRAGQVSNVTSLDVEPSQSSGRPIIAIVRSPFQFSHLRCAAAPAERDRRHSRKREVNGLAVGTWAVPLGPGQRDLQPTERLPADSAGPPVPTLTLAWSHSKGPAFQPDRSVRLEMAGAMLWGQHRWGRSRSVGGREGRHRNGRSADCLSALSVPAAAGTSGSRLLSRARSGRQPRRAGRGDLRALVCRRARRPRPAARRRHGDPGPSNTLLLTFPNRLRVRVPTRTPSRAPSTLWRPGARLALIVSCARPVLGIGPACAPGSRSTKAYDQG
jgi:hypothetical protein